MNDKELADKIVACGVGRVNAMSNSLYVLPVEEVAGVVRDDSMFVRDWRVVGALMEKARHDSDMTWFWDSLNLLDDGMDWPRAICEACVEALRPQTQ